MTTLLAPYPKINGLYKRDRTTNHFIMGDWAQPEFGYLAALEWQWTEKVDGTNIRLGFEHHGMRGNEHAYIAGRTDSAQIPPVLLKRLVEIQRSLPYETVFPDTNAQVTLYGEGYGQKIQKIGSEYISDGVDFVLFDVRVGEWWLTREAVVDVAENLGLTVVPEVLRGSIEEASKMVYLGFKSAWSGVSRPEGLVGRPALDLRTRRGDRIVTKVKGRDFDHLDPHPL